MFISDSELYKVQQIQVPKDTGKKKPSQPITPT